MTSGKDSQNRLKEILAVLNKHNIVKGLTPVKLRCILEDFGPTFVKLGQIMSMRPDILPAAYCKELEKLRADVNPMAIDEVYTVVEGEYQRRVSDVFATFDDKPIGSASIAQVHGAVLHDGTRVVVKVQRPGIREVMSKDMALLRTACKALRLTPVSGTIDFGMVLDELWSVSQQEMDFLVEAHHAEEFFERNRDVKFATCPTIVDSLTTSKVLVMEYIDGFSIDDIAQLDENGYDRSEIGSKLTDNYMKQIIEDGFFHADPHPGNIRIRDGQIVWIDMGMMGRLSNRDRSLCKQAIHAVVQRDVNELKSIVLQMGVYHTPINQVQLYADIDGMLDKYCAMDMGDVDMGKLLEELLTVASSHKISMPKGVSMLGRGMMTLEGVISTVSPELNLMSIAASRMAQELQKDFDPKKEAVHTAQRVYASTSKALDIPALLSDFLKATNKGQTKFNLEFTGSKEPLSHINRMVKELIVCILASSLLMASSLLCTTDMQPRTLGIPTLGFFGYLIAFALTLWLLLGKRR